MTTLDFSDSEPTVTKASAKRADTFAVNNAIYDRLQGRTKKSALSKYSWVAMPVAAVAVIGIVAATSTPNRSADNVAAGPVDAKPAVVASNSMGPSVMAASPDEIHAKIAGAPAASVAAPAPVRTAQAAPVRRAPAAEPTARAASATRPQSVPAQSLSAAPAPTAVNPPVVAAPAPAMAAPAPEVTAAPPVEAAPAPVNPAPAEAAPAAAEPAPAAQ